MNAFIVRAKDRDGNPLDMHYAALAETPEEAIRLVAQLVSPGTQFEAPGAVLSSATVQAIRLRPGQAKLI